ncbi:MAG TPA: hypothetical protein VN721_13105 [Flavipsychrobacter sp.]|nr:hypothetical protein [Flavipsychrobacter sp.]
MIKYKIDGHEVDKTTFEKFHPDLSILELWENAIEAQKEEIDNLNVTIILKLINGRFKVLTDTFLLFKLIDEINKVNAQKHAHSKLVLFE